MNIEDSPTRPGTCPSREQLAAFNLGRLSEDAEQSLAAHVETCHHCLAVLRELDERPDPLLADLRGPVPADASAALDDRPEPVGIVSCRKSRT